MTAYMSVCKHQDLLGEMCLNKTKNGCEKCSEGYYLESWNTRPDGSGRAYAPGISLTPTENMILYAQWAKRSASGTENGHEWVDLGLSVKWATYNVGATTPEGFGDYFAWGETAPKESYSFESYKHGGIYEQGTDRVCRLYKYCLEAEDGYNGFVDNKSELELVDDAAHVNWGGKWRVPTEKEVEELEQNCSYTWITKNGVNGVLATSNINGQSIFLPAAGYKYYNNYYGIGEDVRTWTTSLSSNSFLAYFISGSEDWLFHSHSVTGREYGHTVRAVCPY